MLAQSFLSEFEAEAQTTRRFLERLPQDKLAWKPHEKSMSAGQLALHIAKVPGAIIYLATQESVPAPDFSKPNPSPASLDEVLRAHDESAAMVRKTLPTLDDQAMQKTWRATVGGKDVFVMPKAGLIRMILLNHWIHHRGQLGVYLRMLGAKVPYSYGPSADEAPAMS